MIKIWNAKNTNLYLILSLFFSTQIFAAEACLAGCLYAKYGLAATSVGLNAFEVGRSMYLNDPESERLAICCQAAPMVSVTGMLSCLDYAPCTPTTNLVALNFGLANTILLRVLLTRLTEERRQERATINIPCPKGIV